MEQLDLSVEDLKSALERETSLCDNINRYEILQDETGEIVIKIFYHESGPNNSQFIYDGGDMALLYRNRESAMILNEIEEPARKPLKNAKRVFVVEVLNDEEIVRGYLVALHLVKDLGEFLP